MSEHIEVAKKSLFAASYNVVGGLVGYITMFFALRLVGKEAWGIYGSALGIAGLLSIFATLGLDATHIKMMTKLKDKAQCMGAYFILKTLFGFLYLVISFLGFFLIGEFLGYKFESIYLEHAVYITIFGFFVSSIANAFKTSYQVKFQARRTVVPMFVQLLVQDMLIIVFSFMYYLTPKISQGYVGVLFSYAYLLGNVARLIVYVLWSFKDKFSYKLPSREVVKEYLHFTFPLALLGAVGIIQAYTDRTMLQFFWNSAEVGGYFTIQKIALSVVYLGGALVFFLYPAQSKYFEQNRKEDFFQITKKAERYLSLFTIPFVFFTLGMAPEILNLFRGSLIPYSLPLILLMIYAYLNVINRPYSSQMTSANKPGEVLKVGLIQATANVVLNSIFIPTSILGIPLLGMKSTGAALATLLSFLVGFIYFRYRVWKILGTHYEKRILLHLWAGADTFMLFYILKFFIGPMYPWYELLGASILFLLIYAAFLHLLGEFGNEEVLLIKRILGIS
jgi:O-antigen/teichoic acid export membrane protein